MIKSNNSNNNCFCNNPSNCFNNLGSPCDSFINNQCSVVSRPRATGPTGPTGATGPIGPTGATGPTGPAGGGMAANSFIIPFSIADYAGYPYLTTTDTGNPSMVGFSGYGGGSLSSITLTNTDWQNQTISVNNENNYYYACAFIMPRTATLKKLYCLISTSDNIEYDAGVSINPFVTVATCNNDNLVYTILGNTTTYTAPYVGGAAIPKFSVRKGENLDLNVTIPEGVLVAIVTGITSQVATTPQELRVSLSGSLYFEES